MSYIQNKSDNTKVIGSIPNTINYRKRIPHNRKNCLFLTNEVRATGIAISTKRCYGI